MTLESPNGIRHFENPDSSLPEMIQYADFLKNENVRIILESVLVNGCQDVPSAVVFIDEKIANIDKFLKEMDSKEKMDAESSIRKYYEASEFLTSKKPRDNRGFVKQLEVIKVQDSVIPENTENANPQSVEIPTSSIENTITPEEEKKIEEVLRIGIFRAQLDVPTKISPTSKYGFQILSDGKMPLFDPKEESLIEGQFTAAEYNLARAGLNPVHVLSAQNIRELVTISPVNILEKAVKITYRAFGPKNYKDKKDAWYVADGRPGQFLFMELFLPESDAQEFFKATEDNPKLIRLAVERIMKEKILNISEEEWRNLQAKGLSSDLDSSLRPPWEKWDREGSAMYIQPNNFSGRGFNPDYVKKV